MFHDKLILLLISCICYSCIYVQASILTKSHEMPSFRSSKNPSSRITEISLYVENIAMPIDHFNTSDNSTFDLRYAYRNDLWNGTGPLFLYIGGESDLENQIGYIEAGLMVEMAEEKGGYLLLSEHRYYGQSVPNKNLETANMKQLTLDQALADLAYLIRDRQKKAPGLEKCKVIIVGCSYPANLAAWMRLKYPDVVDAAHSSSGVLRNRVNNYAFNEIVQRDLKNNPPCLNTIKNAFLILQSLVQVTEGANLIRNDFGLCEPIKINDTKDVQSFFDNLIVMIDTIPQYDHQGTYINIDTMCDMLLANSTFENDYMRLANFIQFWRKTYNQGGCIISYQKMVDYYRDTSPYNLRSWQYQSCSQLGNFLTTDSKNQPFSNTVPLDYWYGVCADVFGDSYTTIRINTGVEQTVQEYGGGKPNVTKVVFTVGTVDPWSGVGMNKAPNHEAPVIKIKGGSHCADVGAPSANDTEDLKQARIQVKKHLYSWI